MGHLLKTWNSIFPPAQVQLMELQTVKANNPTVHVNPKFLQSQPQQPAQQQQQLPPQQAQQQIPQQVRSIKDINIYT